jgi:hypothetical protein
MATPRAKLLGSGRCVARAFVAIGLGQLDEVGGCIEAAARVPAGGPFHDGFTSGVAAASSLNCMHRWLVGDLGGSRAAAVEAQDLSGGWDSVALLLLGASRYWLEESDEGVAQLQAAADRTRDGALHPPAVFALGMLASVQLLRGELDAAGRHAEDALALSETAGLLENWNTALAHTARGGLRLRAGADGALPELERGLELARRGSGPVETVLAMVAMAEARHQAGEREAARELLAEARWTIDAAPDPGPLAGRLVDKAARRMHVTPRGLGAVPVSIDEFSDRELAVLRMLSGAEFRGVLFWVNLARKDKQAEPSAVVLQREQIPVRQEGDAIRVLVGEGSPVRLGTPSLILDVELPTGGEVTTAVPSDFQGFAYLLEGEAQFGVNRRRAQPPQLVLLGGGDDFRVTDASPGTRFLLMAGKPYGEVPACHRRDQRVERRSRRPHLQRDRRRPRPGRAARQGRQHAGGSGPRLRSA